MHISTLNPGALFPSQIRKVHRGAGPGPGGTHGIISPGALFPASTPYALSRKCTGVRDRPCLLEKCTGVRGSTPGALLSPRTPVHFCVFPFLTRYPCPPVNLFQEGFTPGALFEKISTPYALLKSAPGSAKSKTFSQPRPRMHFSRIWKFI